MAAAGLVLGAQSRFWFGGRLLLLCGSLETRDGRNIRRLAGKTLQDHAYMS